MPDQAVVPWRWVTPLEPVNGSLSPILDSVDTLRGSWKDFIDSVSQEDFMEARRRSLRRHAIETGIIERLYDVSWGVTEALVAEGLTREVAEREEAGLDDDALTTIQVQFEALEFLAASAREDRDLSVIFVRDLHRAITRNQTTYEARDLLGNVVRRQLRHGAWKEWPNHVRREDGSELQYTPPEHVQAEMDRLIELYSETSEAHPLARAAWLHHAFVGIHPFEDGNGRVARALVLLVLLRADYAPLVVDRDRRADYIQALDAANDGDLAPLVRLFAGLEIVALRSEIERPARVTTVGESAVDIARGYAERLRDLKIGTDQARAAAVASLAGGLQDRLEQQLGQLADGIREAFLPIDPEVHRSVTKATPPDERAAYWSAQLVRTAKAANFFTNLTAGSWWVRLRLVVLRQELRYVAAIQKVGPGETGILAVTVFAELVPAHADGDEPRPLPIPVLSARSGDSVTLGQTESLEDRWTDVCELVERTLAAAVAEFGRVLA